ncbi:hypothetical protein P5V15_005630 [Pogonomyrmex californicus]
MSKNGKINYPGNNNDREDIQWFENYEKHSKIKHPEKLKNEDILNYIKDVVQNCRLEVSSGDEDYAGTKKSSNCSVRYLGARFGSSKKIKSRVTSRKNKNITLKRKPKCSSNHNATDTCNYYYPVRKFHFRSNSNLIFQNNSRTDLNNFTKSTYPNLSKNQNSYKYRESSPTFYSWYSKKDHKMKPSVTKMPSFEVTRDWLRNDIRDSSINRSKITNKKSTNTRTFKSRRKRIDDSTYMDIYSNIIPNEKTRIERDSRYCIYKQGEEARMKILNEQSSASFENQQPLNKIYSDQDTTLSYQVPLQNKDYKRHYTSGYHYFMRRSRQPTFSQSNRLTASARLPEASSLHERSSQWENEIGSPLKASSSIMETSIDRSYHTKRKNNMDQRRRGPDILGERGSSCCRRPSLLRKSEKLCKVASTYEDKQWLGCCCEDTEQDETADCSRYCRCPENVNDSTRCSYRLPYEGTYRPITMSKQINYTASLRKILPESTQLRANDEEESEINVSMEEDWQAESTSYNQPFDKFDVFDDVRKDNYPLYNYDYNDEMEDLNSHVLFSDDQAPQTCRSSSKVEYKKEYKKLSNHLKSNQGKVTDTRTTLRKKTTTRYPADKEFSFAIRTKKPVSGDSSRLRYDAAESTCECKEPFHDSPACSIGSCTCVGNSKNTKKNNSDPSRKISSTDYCCDDCCCSLSFTSHDEKDPVKKLESFCEKVKAVNRDTFHKPSRVISQSNAMRTNAQEYSQGDEQNQSELGIQRTIRSARSIETDRLANRSRLRLEKPRHSEASLEKILIYPPRGEVGPPLTLYKRSSNISCRVKGDADMGFRYSVTYVQKFISPTWMPSLSSEVLSQEIEEECDCSADYG